MRADASKQKLIHVKDELIFLEVNLKIFFYDFSLKYIKIFDIY